MTFRDGRSEPRHGARRRSRRRSRRDRGRRRPAPQRSAWSDAEPAIGDVVFGLASTGAGAARVTRRHDLGHRADVPGARRQPDRRQPRAHGAAGAGLVRWAARRRRRPPPRAQHESDRRGLLPGPPGGRRVPRAGRRARARRVGQPAAARASRSRRRSSPGACARRSGCASGRACSSAASRTAARPHRAGIREGDLLVEAAGRAVDRPGQPARDPRRGRACRSS